MHVRGLPGSDARADNSSVRSHVLSSVLGSNHRWPLECEQNTSTYTLQSHNTKVTCPSCRIEHVVPSSGFFRNVTMHQFIQKANRDQDEISIASERLDERASGLE